MKEPHEIFGDASRKAHMAPVRLSPAEEREAMAHAAAGVDRSDEDEDE